MHSRMGSQCEPLFLSLLVAVTRTKIKIPKRKRRQAAKPTPTLPLVEMSCLVIERRIVEFRRIKGTRTLADTNHLGRICMESRARNCWRVNEKRYSSHLYQTPSYWDMRLLCTGVCKKEQGDAVLV